MNMCHANKNKCFDHKGLVCRKKTSCIVYWFSQKSYRRIFKHKTGNVYVEK